MDCQSFFFQGLWHFSCVTFAECRPCQEHRRAVEVLLHEFASEDAGCRGAAVLSEKPQM